ncbi:unnamed protein product [Thelazia callipaeda]|uniref:Sema domain-containing protein n=1 Tax=Thelazia callipaeda TaxID=103827 RepID=A0A0N5CKT7_THECL|nr:unnamed protein product [Thelazia callipaeda]
MSSSGHPKDYICDVSMEISHRFFPLPIVAVPNILINWPHLQEYSFEHERKAIADYEKNMSTLSAKMKDLSATNTTKVDTRGGSNIVVKSQDRSAGFHANKIQPNVILEPCRAVAIPFNERQNTKPSRSSVNIFEEFELKPNFFDLLELSTIDDKAALEQILANYPPPLSTNVAGSSTDSKTELLSTSPIPNVISSIAKNDDDSSLYNLPTTLKTCNSSVGVSVSSTSYKLEILEKTSTLSTIYPDNIFTVGRLKYRTLLLNPQSASLYVGASGNLFRLWAYNINTTASTDGLYAHIELPVSRTDAEECRRAGHTDCTNGVRLMFLKEGRQTLLVCSSNAMKPQIRELDALTLQERSSPENVIGVCSPYTDLNTTAVLVEWGNPEDIPAIYSGIRTGLVLDNHLIYRPPLIKNNKEIYSSMRTIYTDSKWLYEPDFVASFDIGKYVYFFFREIAIEHENCGRVVYSRVARICKKDVGGKNVMRQVWTTFVKARLNCSISSTSSVYFNEIQSLQRVEGTSDNFFYATLTTSDVSFGGSAVCVFSLSKINQLFDHGYFLEQTSSGGWTTTPSESVPGHRPGTAISDDSLHFARSHLLMADAVSADLLLLALRNELFTHIAVDTLENVNIVFIYSHGSQKLHKIAHWFDGLDTYSKLLATYNIKTNGNIFAMTLLPGEFVYLAGENHVAQYLLSQCSHYAICIQCARDPYCSWNTARGSCHTREQSHLSSVGWITAISKNVDKCLENVKRTIIYAYSGDTLHLTCVVHCTWFFDGDKVSSSEKRLLTIEGGLISGEESGIYKCFFSEEIVMIYEVTVDEAECAQPTSVAQFKSKYREWCNKFAKYKQSAEKWQLWYDDNAAHCPKQRIADFSHIVGE